MTSRPNSPVFTVPPPAPAIGDSWTYQYTDVWKGAKGNINRVEVAAIDEAGAEWICLAGYMRLLSEAFEARVLAR